jgi:hypothetical protein
MGGHRLQCRGVAAGFLLKGGHLVCLVPYLQGEMMQGLPQDGVGAVVERWRGWTCLSCPRNTVGEWARASGSLGMAAWLLLCCVLWNGVYQHSMYEKIG